MTIKQKQIGFTLIEVMIVVAIIGVLASLAYPSFKESAARSRRAEARVVLTQYQVALSVTCKELLLLEGKRKLLLQEKRWISL